MQAHAVAASTPLEESVVRRCVRASLRGQLLSRAMSDMTMRAPFTTA